MFLFGFNQEEATDVHLFTYFFGRSVGLWYLIQNYSWPGPPNLYPSEHRLPSRIEKLVLVFYFFLSLSQHDAAMTKSLIYSLQRCHTMTHTWLAGGLQGFFVICILKVTPTTDISTASNVLGNDSKRVIVRGR